MIVNRRLLTVIGIYTYWRTIIFQLCPDEAFILQIFIFNKMELPRTRHDKLLDGYRKQKTFGRKLISFRTDCVWTPHSLILSTLDFFLGTSKRQSICPKAKHSARSRISNASRSSKCNSEYMQKCDQSLKKKTWTFDWTKRTSCRACVVNNSIILRRGNSFYN